MVKYSIIIPIFNCEKTIRQCLDSIISQSYSNYELILVNDCSTDDSLKICKEYKDSFEQIKLISLSKNCGVSHARNIGLDNALGKYITFIDSDDFIGKDYFKTIDAELDEKYQLLCFGNYDYFENKFNDLSVKINNMSIEIEGDKNQNWNLLLLKTFFASPCNKVYLQSIISSHKIRFDEICVCYEDYLFNLNYCLYVYAFKCISNPLYYYRQVLGLNPVLKRRWRVPFEISNKVALKTNEFIQVKGKTLEAIRAYTLKSFLVEIEYYILIGKEPYQKVKRALKNDLFIESIHSLKKNSITFGLLLTLLKIKCFWLSYLIIKYRLVNRKHK